jgi:GntR family transcriptional repressor for pyruvate dehydrogenase complex
MEQKITSTTQLLFQKMLDRIQSGQWPINKPIPSERALMKEFGVSRICVRESLSMLRALGILETCHGRSSIIRRMDSEIIGRLFPLMLSLQGEQTYGQIFEVRLNLESRTAYLAALRRSEQDLQELDKLLELLRVQLEQKSVQTDLTFHIKIAQATKNPLFPLLLKALSGFVTYVQVLSCKDNPDKRHRALLCHETIAEAIRNKDPERARVEMESHLRSSADRMLKSGMFKTSALRNWH